MEIIPKQVRDAAKEYGSHIFFLGEHKGKKVYEVCTLDENGIGVETGMPILAFFDGENAHIEISDSNLQIIDAFS